MCLLWDVDPRNGDNNVVIVATSASSYGSWRIELYGDDVRDGGRFDAWIDGESGEEFSIGVEDRMRIESPATARNGIAVGAFADPEFPTPSFSVWEESMYPWVRLAADMQHFAQGRIGPPLGTNDLPQPA